MKKFNWGYKIIFIYGAFVLGILFMVYQSSQQKFDLVENDYYAAELKYQDVIDATARAKALGGVLIVKHELDSIKLILPSVFKGVNVKGKVHLYYAADKQQDLSFDFETLNAFAAFKTNKQKRGNYTIKLDLVKSGVLYYYEQKIFL
jgi:ribosomal 30S subunit maturation factor RimM